MVVLLALLACLLLLGLGSSFGKSKNCRLHFPCYSSCTYGLLLLSPSFLLTPSPSNYPPPPFLLLPLVSFLFSLTPDLLTFLHCNWLAGLAADSGRGLCLSEACVTVASQMVEAMDRSADPCQDFYQFSCGGWMRKNPLPDGRSRWSTFNSIWEQNQALLKHLLGEGVCVCVHVREKGP